MTTNNIPLLNSNKFLIFLKILSIIIIFLSVNVISNIVISQKKIDLTYDGLYTVSGNTKNILANITEPIKIRLFFSDKLSRNYPQLRDYGQRVRELLESYSSQSNDRLIFERIDPEPFTDLEDLAMVYGLQGISVNDAGEKFYFGLVASNSVDDTLVVPYFDVSREKFLEYDLTRIVNSLAFPKKLTIGMISSLPVAGGLASSASDLSDYVEPYVIHQRIIELFNVKNLGTGITDIPDDVDQLIVIHPKDLKKETLYAIDQFVLSGRGALFFTDPFSEIERNSVDPKDRALNIPSSNLSEIFNAWGFSMEPGMIVGDQIIGRKVSIGGRENSRITTYILWLALESELLSKDDIATANLSFVFSKTPGSLRVEDVNNKNIIFEPLITTTNESMLVERFKIQYRPDPESLLSEFKSDNKNHVIASRISGKFKSAYPESADKSDHISQAESANIIVFADTDILADDTWISRVDGYGRENPTPTADNGRLIINAIESLSGGSNLIGLRSRGITNRPFVVVADLQMKAEMEYRETEKKLQMELSETEKKLAELQSFSGVNERSTDLILSEEQKETIEEFKQQIFSIRKKLRDVQLELRQEIDNLNSNIQFINIWSMPLIVIFLTMLVWLINRKKHITHLKSLDRI